MERFSSRLRRLRCRPCAVERSCCRSDSRCCCGCSDARCCRSDQGCCSSLLFSRRGAGALCLAAEGGFALALAGGDEPLHACGAGRGEQAADLDDAGADDGSFADDDDDGSSAAATDSAAAAAAAAAAAETAAVDPFADDRCCSSFDPRRRDDAAAADSADSAEARRPSGELRNHHRSSFHAAAAAELDDDHAGDDACGPAAAAAAEGGSTADAGQGLSLDGTNKEKKTKSVPPRRFREKKKTEDEFNKRYLKHKHARARLLARRGWEGKER